MSFPSFAMGEYRCGGICGQSMCGMQSIAAIFAAFFLLLLLFVAELWCANWRDRFLSRSILPLNCFSLFFSSPPPLVVIISLTGSPSVRLYVLSVCLCVFSSEFLSNSHARPLACLSRSLSLSLSLSLYGWIRLMLYPCSLWRKNFLLSKVLLPKSFAKQCVSISGPTFSIRGYLHICRPMHYYNILHHSK